VVPVLKEDAAKVVVARADVVRVVVAAVAAAVAEEGDAEGGWEPVSVATPCLRHPRGPLLMNRKPDTHRGEPVAWCVPHVPCMSWQGEPC